MQRGNLFNHCPILFQIVSFHRVAHLIGEATAAAFHHIGTRGNAPLLDLGTGVPHDAPQLVHLAGTGYKREGKTRLSGASGASDAVDVIFHILWDIIIENRAHTAHVDPPCRHVGGNQHVHMTAPEHLHHMIACLLLHIAVQPFRHVTAHLHGAHQLVHLLFGVAENHGGYGAVNVHQAAHGFNFVTVGYHIIILIDFLHGEFLANDLDHFGIPKVLMRDFHDFGRHGCRKQRGLPVFGNITQNGFDILAEAHREHFVRLIEYHHLHVVQKQGMTAHMIHQTSRRADNNLCTAPEQPDLPLDVLSAVNRRRADAFGMRREATNLITRLYSQFAGGTNHQCLHTLAMLPRNHLNGGNRKGSGFARAGLRLPDHVSATEQQRNGLGLNGGCFLIADIVYGLQNAVRNSQFRKG